MIKVNDLSFSYGKVPCLEHISLNLEKGRIYGLLGENGVGKTTLLTLLCGLKKPLSGTIDLNGEVPYARTPSFLQNVYYLPDEVAPLQEKAASFAAGSGKFRPGYSHEKFLEAMAVLETDPGQKMNTMSAGQLKKTYISFALASNAPYLFLDEPTNGLDIPSKAQFRKLIMSMTDEDSTLVISTHQVKDLENIIDPIIVLDNKAVLLNASLSEIAEKLYFDYGNTVNPDSLYAEQVPGGLIQVYRNTSGAESKINIEALFNTAHNHKELVKNLFSNE